MRYVSPAGSPIAGADLRRWAAALVSRRDVAAELQAAIASRFATTHVALLSTGRAGMTVLLRALRRLAPERTEVIIPSYTCYSVAASVVKAGLRPHVVDVDPRTLDYSMPLLEAARFDRVLAVIATNLYGYPSDLPTIAALAAGRGAFVIDDAAQAMGATVDGRPSGTWGDAGLFSFDKGKNVSAIDGGVVVTSSDRVAGALHDELRTARDPSATQSAVNIVKALVYTALLPPSRYPIANKVLPLGKTIYSTEFPLERSGRVLTALATVMFERLDAFTTARARNATELADRLSTVAALHSVRPLPSAKPAYLRLPFVVDRAATRDRLLDSLNRAGIGATGSYPGSIEDIPELRGVIVPSSNGARGGRLIAERIVTLPTHPFVSPLDIDVIVSVAAEAAATRQQPRTASCSKESALCAE